MPRIKRAAAHPAFFLLLAAVAFVSCTRKPAAIQVPELPPFTPDTLAVPAWDSLLRGTPYDPARCAFVVLEPDSNRIRVFNPAEASRGTLPASTFKIVLTVLGIELGPLTGPDYLLSYDSLKTSGLLMNGSERREAQRDLTLREAFQVSVPWYFQEIARNIGPVQLAAWLDSLDYGNADYRAGYDQFWLAGGFRISPYEQADFLYRLLNDRTPIACRPQEVLREIALFDSTATHRLYGKTGWAMPGQDSAAPHVGWVVGWVEIAKQAPTEKQRRVYYALRLLHNDPVPATWAGDRKRMAEQFLRAAGYGSVQVK